MEFMLWRDCENVPVGDHGKRGILWKWPRYGHADFLKWDLCGDFVFWDVENGQIDHLLLAEKAMVIYQTKSGLVATTKSCSAGPDVQSDYGGLEHCGSDAVC